MARLVSPVSPYFLSFLFPSALCITTGETFWIRSLSKEGREKKGLFPFDENIRNSSEETFINSWSFFHEERILFHIIFYATYNSRICGMLVDVSRLEKPRPVSPWWKTERVTTSVSSPVVSKNHEIYYRPPRSTDYWCRWLKASAILSDLSNVIAHRTRALPWNRA